MLNVNVDIDVDVDIDVNVDWLLGCPVRASVRRGLACVSHLPLHLQISAGALVEQREKRKVELVRGCCANFCTGQIVRALLSTINCCLVSTPTYNFQCSFSICIHIRAHFTLSPARTTKKPVTSMIRSWSCQTTSVKLNL